MIVSDLQISGLMMLVIIYVFNRNYQQNFTTSQPTKVEYKFDGVVSNNINGYALVLTNKLVSVNSNGQRHSDLT